MIPKFHSWYTGVIQLSHIAEASIIILSQGAKTIKKNTNSTQNKSQTHRAKQYEVTSFLSTYCEFLFLPVTASLKAWGLLQVSARGRLVERRIYSAVDKSNINER